LDQALGWVDLGARGLPQGFGTGAELGRVGRTTFQRASSSERLRPLGRAAAVVAVTGELQGFGEQGACLTRVAIGKELDPAEVAKRNRDDPGVLDLAGQDDSAMKRVRKSASSTSSGSNVFSAALRSSTACSAS